MQGADRFFSNQKMKLLCRDDHCSVYQMKNETGTEQPPVIRCTLEFLFSTMIIIFQAARHGNLKMSISSVSITVWRDELNGK